MGNFLKDFDFIVPFLYPISILATSLIIYFILKKYFFTKLKKFQERFDLDKEAFKGIILNLNRLLNILLVLVILNVFIHFPYIDIYIQKYIISILKINIIETESIKISIYSLIKGILTFYILLLITKIIRRIIEAYIKFKSKKEEVASTIDILVYHTALIFIFFIALSNMGITWKILLPIAGALGIGIGFGIQDIVNNFISGFIILIGRTIKRGDWITIGDKFGKVVDIGVRTSTIRTLDNIDIIIPNSQLIGNQLINWSYIDPVIRIHIPVGVSYGSDVEKVKNILIEVAQNTDFVIKNKPIEARFIEFGDSSLNFELLVWINIRRIPIFLAKSELNYKIWFAFKENGIEIPFPQRDVWFKNELIIKQHKVDKE